MVEANLFESMRRKKRFTIIWRGCAVTCIRTHTLQQRAVVDVAAGAVAAVPGDVVDTHAVLAHLRLETFALVHI